MGSTRMAVALAAALAITAQAAAPARSLRKQSFDAARAGCDEAVARAKSRPA